MKLEVVVIPVLDIDRAKKFYWRLGWRLDADFAFDNGLRALQFTPPGSGASLQFGTKVTAVPTARHKACTWSSSTLGLLAISSLLAVSMSAKRSTLGSQ